MSVREITGKENDSWAGFNRDAIIQKFINDLNNASYIDTTDIKWGKVYVNEEIPPELLRALKKYLQKKYKNQINQIIKRIKNWAIDNPDTAIVLTAATVGSLAVMQQNLTGKVETPKISLGKSIEVSEDANLRISTDIVFSSETGLNFKSQVELEIEF